MKRDICVAVSHSSGEPYTLEKIKLGDLRDDELLVRVEASGICHTDFIAEKLVPLPAVFGHEACGTVEEIGSSVKGLRPGDRVVVSYPSCGVCSGCIVGKPYLCDEHMSLAFSGLRRDGSRTTTEEFSSISTSFFQQSSFASHAIVQSRNVVKVSSEVASVILAAIPCGVQTGAGSVLNSFAAGPGDSIAVFGAGTVGLSAVMAAHIAGLFPIICVDVVQSRLDLALELGAHLAFHANDPDLMKKIISSSRNGISYSLETSGNEKSLEVAIECLRTGGQCGMVISPHFGQKYPFSPTSIFKGAKVLKGIIQGSSVPADFLPKILDWYEAGRLPLEKIIKTYSFVDINAAALDVKSGHTVKAVLTMD